MANQYTISAGTPNAGASWSLEEIKLCVDRFLHCGLTIEQPDMLRPIAGEQLSVWRILGEFTLGIFLLGMSYVACVAVFCL